MSLVRMSSAAMCLATPRLPAGSQDREVGPVDSRRVVPDRDVLLEPEVRKDRLGRRDLDSRPAISPLIHLASKTWRVDPRKERRKRGRRVLPAC